MSSLAILVSSTYSRLPLVRWLSGRKQRFAKAPYLSKGTEGSNPSLTALKIMRAMLLRGAGKRLELADLPQPVASASQLLIRVAACAVCRTDLHIIDGELADPKLP